MIHRNRFAALVIGSSLIIASCSKVEGPYRPNQNSNVPASYNFTNVDYSGQTTRMDMLAEMVVYMKTGNTAGTFVSSAQLKNMFSNSGSPFSNPDLNAATSKQLKNKCFLPDQALFESYMDSLSIASQSAVAAGPGVAGVAVSSTDPSKKYLLSANGVEYAQVIEKGLMGGVFYYQAINTYLCEDGVGSTVDNSTVTPGQGTDMEHHWDEGFGYFGAPVDFPSNISFAKYWAKYSNTVNAHLNTNEILMDAFLTGRAAISASDYAERDQQILVIREYWEKIAAAVAIHYINESISNFSDDAKRCHTLSEATAFINSLKYNAWKTISDTDISTALSEIGMNFYAVTLTGLNNAKDIISTAFNLDAIKDVL